MIVASPQPWYVYLLECRGARIYTGVTPRLAARLAAHRAGRGARFTRMYPPEQLLGAKVFPGHGEALREEQRIKRLPPAEKRRLAATWKRQNDGPEGTLDHEA
ncbi:GIY-YIG nuclease family protein [Thioalkalivibrio sp. ALMg9]|uniref:GIY-YIG nuclease family protein n=1 Tax=Thioalkalivibrio sp. ALMg9 TaxID=1266912 RepID=UPI0003754295|nr:GIY-YIG nuclease family protein [Thioalkalivibrio sp. ALMg9]